MLANLITFIVYAFILIAIADIILYITVKIKERKNKKEIKDIKTPVIDVDVKDINESKKII